MCRTLCESRTIAPVVTSAPPKAANIISNPDDCLPPPATNRSTAQTDSLAPEDMPSTYGPAMGLPKKVCSRYPDTASAPPKSTVMHILGSRICVKIFLSCSLPPPSRISTILPGSMETLPSAVHRSAPISSAAASAANTAAYPPLCSCPSVPSFFIIHSTDHAASRFCTQSQNPRRRAGIS